MMLLKKHLPFQRFQRFQQVNISFYCPLFWQKLWKSWVEVVSEWKSLLPDGCRMNSTFASVAWTSEWHGTVVHPPPLLHLLQSASSCTSVFIDVRVTFTVESAGLTTELEATPELVIISSKAPLLVRLSSSTSEWFCWFDHGAWCDPLTLLHLLHSASSCPLSISVFFDVRVTWDSCPSSSYLHALKFAACSHGRSRWYPTFESCEHFFLLDRLHDLDCATTKWMLNAAPMDAHDGIRRSSDVNTSSSSIFFISSTAQQLQPVPLLLVLGTFLPLRSSSSPPRRNNFNRFHFVLFWVLSNTYGPESAWDISTVSTVHTVFSAASTSESCEKFFFFFIPELWKISNNYERPTKI